MAFLLELDWGQGEDPRSWRKGRRRRWRTSCCEWTEKKRSAVLNSIHGVWETVCASSKENTQFWRPLRIGSWGIFHTDSYLLLVSKKKFPNFRRNFHQKITFGFLRSWTRSARSWRWRRLGCLRTGCYECTEKEAYCTKPHLKNVRNGFAHCQSKTKL